MAEQTDYHLDLHLETIEDLFVDPDTNPFENPHLRVSGMQTLLDEMYTFSTDLPFQLTIYLPEDQITPDLHARVKDAIRRYCEFQVGTHQREVEHTRYDGRRSMRTGLVGMAFFLILSAVCYTIYGNAGNPLVAGLAGILATFFSVASWVIIWGPVDMLVYGWRPVLREAKLYHRIGEAQLTIKPEPGTTR